VLFFPKTYAEVMHELREDLVCVVRGRVNRRDDVPTIYASEMSLPDTTQAAGGPLVIEMPTNRCTPPRVERLKDVLLMHAGPTEVHLRLRSSPERATLMRLDSALGVTPSPSLYGDLKALLGPSCLA